MTTSGKAANAAEALGGLSALSSTSQTAGPVSAKPGLKAMTQAESSETSGTN